MTVACGGKCGRSGCPYVGKDENALNAHVGGVKAAREGKGWFSKSKLSPSSTTTGSVTGAASPRRPEAQVPFYAPLKELPAGFGKPEEKAAPGKAAPVPTGPLFDSTPWWVALGELLDTTLLAEKKVKVHMTEEKAKRLDASLQAAGWTVTANPNPVSLPYWAPIGITVFGAFVLPVVIAYVPDLIKKARERAKEAVAARTKAAVPTPPPGPAPMRVEVPKVAPPAPEDEEAETRMHVPPPPFQWAPMPWREPGAR